MNKMTALVVLIAGVAVVVAALADVFGMSQGLDLDLGDLGGLKTWPTERIALLVVGIAVGLFGALMMLRGGKKK